MVKESLFIVIEGLDGSGKTSVARQLANVLDHLFRDSVKLTFEPHDPSCAGLFIRQVLMKKIRDFSPSILPLAFATNRLDHCDREINPWLGKGNDKIVICDRYYLSSLVYQSSEEISFNSIMNLNEKSRKPNLTFFINVNDKVCYERMKIRNQPKELFEKKISQSRLKYYQAIDYLRNNHGETIIEIDGSGSIVEVVTLIVEKIFEFAPQWRPSQPVISFELVSPHIFTLNGKIDYTIEEFINTKKHFFNRSGSEISREINKLIHSLSFDQLGSIFLDYVRSLGFVVGEKMPWTHIDCYELTYMLPANIHQRGTALLINETQRYDVILQSLPQLYEMSDFMIVFSPGPSEAVNTYFERDIITYLGKKNNESISSLSPNIQITTQNDLSSFIYDIYIKQNEKTIKTDEYTDPN